MRLPWIVAITGALLLAAPARAQAPTPQMQEILIKTTLLTFTDANLTGNYDVLHAKMAKPFREQFTPDRLKQIFKAFADQKINLGVIATKTPIATAESKLDERGALLLRGYFDTTPSRVFYDLDFMLSEGEWKAIKLNVNVKPASEK